MKVEELGFQTLAALVVLTRRVLQLFSRDLI